MKYATFLTVALAVLAVCSVTAAQVFTEDFESYAAGSEMHGQGGWKGWFNTASAGAPASDAYAYSGTNSVELIGTADLVHEFDITGGRWEFKIKQFIPSGTTGETYFILLDTYNDDNVDMEWSVQTVFNLGTGAITTYSGATGVVSIVYDEWVELRCLIDLDNNTVEEYYDGVLIDSSGWSATARTTLQAIDLYGNGASSVYYDDVEVSEYLVYKAQNPSPADGEMGVQFALLQWTAGDTGALHDVYFSTSPDLTESDLVSAQQPALMYFNPLGLTPGQTYYWRVDEVEEDGTTVHEGDVWTFTAMPEKAYAPVPADGAATSVQTAELSWSPGQGGLEEYHLYFGDDLAAVQQGAAEADQGELTVGSFSTGLLRAGTTYYWRVDENTNGGAVQTGDVWSFTTGQPIEDKIVRQWWLNLGTGNPVTGLTSSDRYPSDPDGSELLDLFEGPVNWDEAYGSRLFGWLIPPQSGNYTFWIASDDYSQLWLSTDEDPANVEMIANVAGAVGSRVWTTYEAQESDPIALQAGQKYYIQALMKEGVGGDNIAVAWQAPGGGQEVIPGSAVDTYALLPLHAAMPSPENGAVNTVQSLTLTWFAGENAAQHDVYFGEDKEAVLAADTSTADIYQGRQSSTSFNPGALEWGKTYYWRVDEINTGNADSPWTGALWSFTTAEFIPVDDFESYSNTVGERVFETWIDGYGFTLPEPGDPGNGTGSGVGHDIWSEDSPYYNGLLMETRSVHGGDQAMPLYYNNAEAPYYSETERTWTVVQDWTVGGVDTLSLWFRGRRANSQEEPMYVAVEDSAGHVGVSVNPDPAAVRNNDWTQWEIALSDLADAGVNLAAVKTLYIGLGDRSNPAVGSSGRVSIDDIRVVK